MVLLCLELLPSCYVIVAWCIVHTGVYNPILNHWTVPPSNPRVAAGLAFAPTTMFTRPTPATIRTPR